MNILSKQEMTIKVPGKLMVAGEFSVLVPNQHLAVTAVDRFVYATISASKVGELTLSDFNLLQLRWNYRDGQLSIDSDDARLSFVKAAMQVTCTYLEEQGEEITPFSLSIRSELDDASGLKYGLGSSAAVVTAVVSAIIAKFKNHQLDKNLIFKLSALAHVITQGSGSGADVAASVYGGVLKYASFQAEWLLKKYREAQTISEVIQMEWKYLSIHSIELPSWIHFCVGWTGKPASTVKLVERILQQKDDNPKAFARFLDNSEKAVEQLLTGMEQQNISQILSGIKANRQTLAEIGRQADTAIETPLLSKLCDIAESLDGAGKPSGAGGGDCGIAFMSTEEQAIALFEAWKEAGIKPLAIHSHPKGVELV
ncbi:phosphomevalonate kinase [Oceanobacillus sp. CAU 1775]